MDVPDRSTKFIVKDRNEGIVVTFSDGDSGNLLSFSDIARLGEILESAEEQGKKWAFIRQQGADFCLGREHGKLNDSQRETLIGLVQLLQTTDLVIVAAADGRCEAFGVGVFALADISLATARSTFSFPEILEGFAPAIVATWLFDRVPYKQGMNWMMTGERFDANEAVSFGIATRVVANDELDRECETLIEQLSAIDINALRSCKRIGRIMKGSQLDLPSRRAISLKWFGK